MRTKTFPWGRTVLLGFGFLGLSIIWPIFNQFIPLFLQAGNPEFEKQLLAQGHLLPAITGFGLPPVLAMFIMTWDNLINIFVQPWAGARSDQTWNRFGRRKGWILLGAPVALVGFISIPLANTVLAIMAFILITNFGMALFRSPTAAWLGDLYKPEQRSQANGIINMLGGLGGLLAYFGGGYLFNVLGRMAPFLAGALITLVTMATILLFLHEPVTIIPEEKEKIKVKVLDNFRVVWSNPDRSELLILLGILLYFMAFSALETGLSSFAVFSLGLQPGNAAILTGSLTISFILFSIPAGVLGTRFGRKTILRFGLVGLFLAFLAGFFFINGFLSLIIVLVSCGFFWALVNVNSLPLVLDHGVENKIGAYTGLYYFSSQLAAVLGPTLGGVLVSIMGNEYRWMWLFSTAFMALAWWIMSGVRPVKGSPVPTPAS
jgi:maltose/moltooligosaccharide transporter